MKKIITLFTIIFLVAACSSVKKVRKYINKGYYAHAISISVKKLAKDKFDESNQQHIILLKEAFDKAVARDKEEISFLKKDKNSSNYEKILGLYKRLKERQEKIKPLLPLHLVSKKGLRTNVNFKMLNYQNDVVESKNVLLEHLYSKVVNSLKSRNLNKLEYRGIYNDLAHIHKIDSNYRDVKELMKEIHFKGTDFVFVSIKNKTQQVIPIRLKKELLQFDTYGLNDFWTVYHNKKDSYTKYDYKMELYFREISVSPERVNEKELIKEKIIKEKTNAKDSLGNNIKVFIQKKVTCRVKEIIQMKTCDIFAVVNYHNNTNGQLLQSFPLESNFIFEHIYGSMQGDERALERGYRTRFANRPIPFPTNEDMIYDSGQDLKQKLKRIIINYNRH